MLKCFFIAILSLLSLSGFAGGNGPAYSYLGFGLFPYSTSPQMSAMGGAGLAVYNPNYISINNPAQWITVKTTRINSYFSYEGVSEKSPSGSVNYLDNINFDGALFTFPVKDKWAIGFGISPYSLNNYSIKTKESFDGEDFITEHFGSGGLSRFSLGAGFKFSETLNFGVRFDYIHGSIDKNKLTSNTSSGFSEIKTIQDKFSGFSFSASAFGLLTENWLKSDDKLYFSSVIDLPTSLDGSTGTSTSSKYATDTTTVSTNTSLKLPFGIKFGLGYHRNENLIVAMDFMFNKTSSIGYETIASEKLSDQFYLRTGIAYTPQFSVGSYYAEKITYLGGIFLGQNGVLINGKNMDELGFSAGVSLPLPNNSSSFQISGEFAMKGYFYDSPYKDRTFKIMLGINLSELWFQERIID